MMLPLLLAAAVGAAAAPAPGVLRVCDDVIAPITLDPLREFSEKNHTIVQQIFDGLVRFDPAGRIEPALAVSWTRVDSLTTEFKLRSGVRFHDGEPFDAEAVRFSLERFSDPKGGFPGAGFLNSVERVEVVDRLTVRVHTRYQDGILLNRLAGLVTIVPPKAYAERGADFARRPVGTGPFRFVRWDDGARIVLDANREYWGGAPKFDGLTFEFLPASRQVEGLLKGDVDVVTELPGTDTLRVMRSSRARVEKKETFYTIGGSVNVSSGPMSDVRVRQAVNYAIDKEALVRYDLLGNGRPLGSLTMGGEMGHDPEMQPYPYDPAKARELLRQAGYPSGVHLSAVVKAQGARAMQIIATELEKVGIHVDVHPTTDATVIQDIASRPWDFTFGGCPDPLAHTFFIQFLFLSSLSPYSVTRSPEFDRRLDQMISTLDPDAQQRAGVELDRYVHDQALSVFTYQRLKTYGVSRRIHFVPSVTGMPYFSLSAPVPNENVAH